MKNFLRTIFLVEILQGLWFTLCHIFHKPITIQYPDEKREVYPRYRGLHALMKYDDGREKCVACCLCAKICPTEAIRIDSSCDEENKKRIDAYEIDTARCFFCGLCVEVCPEEALVMSDDYELAVYKREDTIYNKDKLLKNGERYSIKLQEYKKLEGSN